MAVTVRYEPPAVNAAIVVAAAGTAAVQSAGAALLAASQPLVPVDTGELKASGTVTPDGPHRVVVSYDAVAPDGYPYGIRQHEDLTLHHPNGGQAKFLEQPLHLTAEQLVGGIAAAVKAVL